ncbi:hypothetical protein RCL1_005313 [Eukaryota sp. TZLM3-RCL]
MLTTPLVIDNGTYSIKTGFAHESAPTVVCPTYKGSLKYPSVIRDSTQPKTFYGDDAINQRSVLALSPVSDIQDWEKLLRHVITNTLGTSIEKHPILISEPPQTSLKYRSDLCQILFEEFNAPSVCFASAAVLSLYATGRLHGLVVSSGHSSSYAVPIINGYSIPNAAQKSNIGGNHVTDHFIRSLRNQGTFLSTGSEKYLANKIKETVCFASPRVRTSCACNYSLPDGTILRLDSERHTPVELLFEPTDFGIEALGLVNSTVSCLKYCDVEARGELYGNIVLSGGSTMYRNFVPRFVEDLKSMSSGNANLRIVSPKNRDHLTWIGGSILSALSSFPSLSISLEQYSEGSSSARLFSVS